MAGKVIKEKWEKGKDLNLRWWKAKLPAKAKSFNFEFPLPDYFGPMIGRKKKVLIADLGAGVISTTGSVWQGVKICLYPSDIWAEEYKELYKYWKIKPFLPIEQQDMINLTYEDEVFDIVHCANALDHCVDPFKALKEMNRVCKIGGWIYLRHAINSGKKERYSMQHQWNIQKEDNDCLFWNYQDKFLLSECIKGFKTVEKRELPNEPVTIVSMLHKL